MANRIAKYVFPSSDAASNAYDQYRSHKNSNGISRYSDTIEIYDDCEDPALAAKICIANGGVSKY